MVEPNSLFVFTIIGGTRYFSEWLNGVKTLGTPHIYVIKDVVRSELLPEYADVKVIPYNSGKPWWNYEARHEGYVSDYSIMLGFIIGVEEFLKTGLTHGIHIDSDVIINPVVSRMMLEQDWDYLQIGIPVIPRDKMHEYKVMPMRFWDSTNLGFSRRVIEQALPTIKQMLENPYPVDFNIHNAIRSVRPEKHVVVNVNTLEHYIKGRKVKFTHAI